MITVARARTRIRTTHLGATRTKTRTPTDYDPYEHTGEENGVIKVYHRNGSDVTKTREGETYIALPSGEKVEAELLPTGEYVPKEAELPRGAYGDREPLSLEEALEVKQEAEEEGRFVYFPPATYPVEQYPELYQEGTPEVVYQPVPQQTDLTKYLMYGGIGLAAFLLMKNFL